MKKYEYMIVYQFEKCNGNGIGRCFVTRENKITAKFDIENIEKAIQDKNCFTKVAILDFKFLREY